MIKTYWRGLRQEFGQYRGRTLLQDFLAGLTVTAVALPLALAFGVSSGADAAAGLITAIVAGIVIGAFSGAFYQISGPTGAMAAILISIVARYQLRGVFIATFLAGGLLILAGLLHLGRLTSFLPAPVITGFTSGIAIIIALGQLDNLLGVHSEGESAIARLLSYRHLGLAPDWSAVILAAGVMLFLILFPKKWRAVVPSSLLAIVLATLVSLVLRLDVRAVGEIPRTLLPDNRLDLFSVSLKEMGELFLPAVSIAMLGMIESLLCGASAGRMTGTRLNSDQELVAQGIGNLLIPFFGGIPATAAIARTSVAIKSGARTRLAGIIHAVGLLLSMLLLAPLMSRIPLSALAGVLIVTAWRMNEWETIRFIFSRRFKSAILKFTATMAATVVFDLTVAILIGFLVALMLMVRQLARIEVSTDKVDMSRIRDADDQLKCRYGNAEVVYISGPLLFAAISGIRDIPAQIGQDIDTVLFSMRGVSHLDLSGAQALQELILTLRRRGLDVVICGVPRQTMTMMERSGLCDLLGRDSFYWSVERALLDRRPACQPEASPAGS